MPVLKNQSRNVPKTRQRDVKLRPCLGWCGGKLIKTDKNHRFCNTCSTRKEFAASSGMENEHGVPNRKGV